MAQIEKEYIIRFNNGTYNLQTNEFTVEPNVMSVKYDYNNEYSSHKDDLMKFISDLVPNELDRKVLLSHISKALLGKINCTCLNIYGGGNSGKTTFINLVAETLGDYFERFDSDILTKRLKNQQRKLSFLKNKRCIVTEIEPTNKIKSSMYKILLGGDRLCVISNDDECEIIDQTHTMCIVSNNQVEFETLDEGVRRRTIYVKFPNVFESDMDMGETIKLWRHDFMLLLIENYKN